MPEPMHWHKMCDVKKIKIINLVNSSNIAHERAIMFFSCVCSILIDAGVFCFGVFPRYFRIVSNRFKQGTEAHIWKEQRKFEHIMSTAGAFFVPNS